LRRAPEPFHIWRDTQEGEKMKRKLAIASFGVVAVLSAGAASGAIISESFDQSGGFFGTTGVNNNLPATPAASGWVVANKSTTLGSSTWYTGNASKFPAQSGSGYISADLNNTTGNNTISDWLLTPQVSFNAGDQLSFWTRVPNNPATFADRLEVRLSTNGSSTNVGANAAATGDFTTSLLVVNPNLVLSGASSYPGAWTQYTATMPVGGSGRVGFRYFVTAGGPSGANSNYVGLDSVNLTAVPEPTTLLTGLLIGSGLLLTRRGPRA